MTGDGRSDQGPPTEESLLAKQSLKYAEDLARVYEEEKARRRELLRINEELRREIGERRRAEVALRESEARFRAIFESVPDYIFIKDTSLRYTHVNPALVKLLRRHPSQIIGRTDEEIYGKTAGARSAEVEKRVLAGNSIEEERSTMIGDNRVTLLETRVPLRDASGKIVGLCGLARDITDRRRMQRSSLDTADAVFPSRAMRETLAKARLASAQNTLVLLLGESGSGKDWLARFIHDHSHRNAGPFFSINCASVAPELGDSELFGHERGAFTGADTRKRGLVELAEGGTLLLNEIGEMSLPLQAKLLEFLDTMSFTRVGGESKISVDTRIIAATNRDLEKEVKEGRFREDLFHRLNVMCIRVPPLRRRRDDIPVLANLVISELEGRMRLDSPPTLSEEAIEALKAYHWPGNVRELRNILERALIISGGGLIEPPHLGLEQVSEGWVFSTGFPVDRSLNDVTKDLKRSMVMEALRRSNGVRTEAARLLRISRNSLNHYLSTLGIEDRPHAGGRDRPRAPD